MATIRLLCESCGAGITHIDTTIHELGATVYKCDYCGTRYVIDDKQLKKWYPPLEQPTPTIYSSTSTSYRSGNIFTQIIYLVVGLFVAVLIFPVAIQQVYKSGTLFNSTTTSTITSCSNFPITQVFTIVLPLIVIIALAVTVAGKII